VTDCWTIIRDFFRSDAGVTLPVFPRERDDFLKGNALFDRFADAGFYEIDKPAQREWQVAESGGSIAEAQSNFNNKCGHCHGKNGASPISERDLRKLSMRYKEEWKSVTYSTIVKGRPDLGMPTWDGILPDHEIKAIVEFLATVQKN
jgi:mono/diheme cytochrome c family protein